MFTANERSLQRSFWTERLEKKGFFIKMVHGYEKQWKMIKSSQRTRLRHIRFNQRYFKDWKPRAHKLVIE